jgi:hypothetical protein
MPSANNTQVAPAPATAGSQPETASDATSGEINLSLADLANELGVGLEPADSGSGAAPETAEPEASDEAEGEEQAETATTTTDTAPDTEPAPADEAPAAAEGTDTEPPDGQQPAEEPQAEGEQPEEKVPGWAQKRFGELTARAKAAEERAAQAEREIQELKTASAQQPATPAQLLAGGDDFSTLDSDEAITAREKQLRAVKSWALENLEGGQLPDGNGGTIELSPEKARKLLAHADRALTEGLPARRAYLTERTQATTVARQAYPWLYDTSQPAAQQEIAKIKRELSGRRVADLPNFDLVLGDAIIGEAVRAGHYRLVKVDPATPKASQGMPGKPPVKGSVSVPTAPKVAPAPRAATAPTIRPSGRTVAPQKKAAQERFEQTGSIEDLADCL